MHRRRSCVRNRDLTRPGARLIHFYSAKVLVFSYNKAEVDLNVFLLAWSITCYRCGGASPSCKTAGSATVECGDKSMPDAVLACQVYTVNYTTLNSVVEFKSKKQCDQNYFHAPAQTSLPQNKGNYNRIHVDI